MEHSEMDPSLSERERSRLERIAAVHREIEELEAASAAATAGLQMRSARTRSTSLAYSIRLDRGEVEAIERRAAAYGLKPTVFARNLIRMGIAANGAGDVALAIERVAAALEELRALVGSSPMRASFD